MESDNSMSADLHGSLEGGLHHCRCQGPHKRRPVVKLAEGTACKRPSLPVNASRYRKLKADSLATTHLHLYELLHEVVRA